MTCSIRQASCSAVFFIYANFSEKICEKEMFFIGLLCNLPAESSQVKEVIFIHREKTTVFQGINRYTYAGL